MSIDDATPAEWNRATAANSEINSPAHYTMTKIECLDYLQDNLGDNFEYFLEGNIKKYLHRFRYKGSAQNDLLKAQFYLNRLTLHHTK